jgi:hypothetical protein
MARVKIPTSFHLRLPWAAFFGNFPSDHIASAREREKKVGIHSMKAIYNRRRWKN